MDPLCDVTLRDDAFGWFGGTVNGRYFITLGNIDDDVDSDLGWRGNVQFGLIVRDPVFADNVGASSAFETDSSPNDATAVASPFRSEDWSSRRAATFDDVGLASAAGRPGPFERPTDVGPL